MKHPNTFWIAETETHRRVQNWYQSQAFEHWLNHVHPDYHMNSCKILSNPDVQLSIVFSFYESWKGYLES